MSKVYSVSFGIAPNDLLNNKNVSLKAKGLFAYLQSKPDDWDFTIKGIVSQLKESFDAVRKGVRELEEAGYLTRKNYQNDKGQWDCDYYLHVDPVTPNPIKKNPKSEKPNTDKPNTENPYTENPYTENPYTENRYTKKERRSKKEEVKKKKVVDGVKTIRNTFQAIDPSLVQFPAFHKIVEAVKKREQDDWIPYIKFVLANKEGDKRFQLKGWNEWYWSDYWVAKQSGSLQEKTPNISVEDLLWYKKRNINPLEGGGTWNEQSELLLQQIEKTCA